MKHRHLTTTLLFLLATVGAFTLLAPAADATHALDPHLQQLPAATPAWQQVNSSGFGDGQTREVTTLAPFGDYLYAGTHNATSGAQIMRAPDGETWSAVTQPGFGIEHDIAPPAILAMTVFNGRLYASTGRGDGPAQIWRTLNGTTWAPMVITGFSDPDTVDITTFAEYNGLLYVGATNLITGAQIWRSYTGDNNSWTQVAPATPGADPATVTALTEFDGALYAAVEFETEAPVQIWRTYGGDWTTVVSDGFGDADTIYSGGMAEFGGYLYAGAGNAADGAQLWRSSDGESWTQVIAPGFGDANNRQVEALFVFQSQLYVSTHNEGTGMELWRSADGATWAQTNPDGFGDGNNTGSNWSNASADFLGQLYAGTANGVDGGELWRMQQDYGVTLTPDQSKFGAAGQTVEYTLTITNNGSLADSFDLTATGQSWTTTLSATQVSLAPAASTTFTVNVTIPPGAADQATDMTTVVATSQGDSDKTDSAVLTTTSVVAPVYGVSLSPDQSMAGPAGGQILYTLWITNTGNVADTFDLGTSGQEWTTQLSAYEPSLTAGGSQAVTVTVGIPSTATTSAIDRVTIQAVSRHDSLKQASVVLMSVSDGLPAKSYLPLVQRNGGHPARR